MLSKCFRTSLILIMCACALPVLAASRGSMRGKVVDCAGDPVAKAYILVHPSGQPGSDVRVPVRRDGGFSIELAPGFYDVFVTGAGFSPVCVKLELRDGKTTTYNPVLRMSDVESNQHARKEGTR